MGNKESYSFGPVWFYVIVTPILVTYMISLMSKVPIPFRVGLILVLWVFFISLIKFTSIKINEININYILFRKSKSIPFEAIEKVHFNRPALMIGAPYHFRINYKIGTESKKYTFETSNYDKINKLIVQFVKAKVPFEVGYHIQAKGLYKKALDSIK